MGSQKYGPKKVRRIALSTGEPITRAWTRGHDAYIATRDHRHGVYWRESGCITWYSDAEAFHFTSCSINGELLSVLEPWE